MYTSYPNPTSIPRNKQIKTSRNYPDSFLHSFPKYVNNLHVRLFITLVYFILVIYKMRIKIAITHKILKVVPIK